MIPRVFLPKFLVCSLCFLLLGAQEVVISEFLASNVSGLTDEDGENSDWIELWNLSGETVDLTGWALTDDADNLQRWVFPKVVLTPGEKLVVFASGKDRTIFDQELHTDFKLSASGEYLALVRPDGISVESKYAPSYPTQYPGVSFGIGSVDANSVILVGADAPLSYWVPENANFDVGGASPFHELGFDDSGWDIAQMGLGYATTTGTDPYDNFIGNGGDIQEDFYRQNTSVYLRVPFTVEDPTAVTSLQFGARYDDGFAIYINGSPLLASSFEPSDGVWDYEARARGNHSDTEAIALELFTIDLSQVNLLAGENILAVHGLNSSPSSSDFLLDCELTAQVRGDGATELIYMPTPTPGIKNGGGKTDLGPVIRKVTKNPERPDLSSQSALTITAEVAASGNAVARVDLLYRRGFLEESSLEMLDDGVAPDEFAGDGVYSTDLPLAGSQAGEMIRWRVESRDVNGLASENPLFFDPLNSPEYYGTVVLDPTLNSDLPVLEWFIENPKAANNRTGTRVAVMHLGEFYDNVYCRIRGGSSAGLSKKSYKFDFNTGHHFGTVEKLGGVRAEEFNLNTTWTDKTYVRQPLSYEVYDLAGSPGSECFLMRVEQNGQFFSVAAYTEQVDKRLLRRERRLDDDGALYKMFNPGTSGTSGVEKKNRRFESNADLSAFVSGMNSSGARLENFIFDNIDLPRQLNYLAATVLTQNNDNMSKNYYLYRDTEGSGEWTQLPWDTDLTWGSHYMTNDNISHDGIWATADYVLGGRNANSPISPSHPFVGVRELQGNRSWNRLIDKLLENDRVKNMFRRRLQTLVDEILMDKVVDDRLEAMGIMLKNDAVLDRAKWGQFGQSQSLTQALAVLEDEYLIPRRTHLSVTHLATNSASYPTAQTSSALLPGPTGVVTSVSFGVIEANPSSLNQGEEYIEIKNAADEAIDLSGWNVTGGVEFEFLSGTILEANGSVYLSPDVSMFRSRAASPTGGEGLNVEGDYSGQVSARGEIIKLINSKGVVVDQRLTPSEESDPQKYLRITEIHFAPLEGKEFEFIELTNIGPDPLDLSGIRFTDGVEAELTGSLAPGEFGLVVSNPSHFPGLKIVGIFSGALNNGGEQLTLRDAAGENVLSFDFVGEWFTAVGSSGYSLALRDYAADWSTWDDRLSWATSSEVGGSPGVDNPVPYSNDYESWIQSFFTEGELEDPFVSGPMADANGDGFSNLMHYALGIDPKILLSGSFADVVIKDGVISLQFDRLIKTPDLNLTVQVSPDLLDWSTLATLTDSETHLNGRETVTYSSPISLSLGSQKFLRIRLTRNP
ncbi:MAG: CotH kinase family protein [Akkermansiaceae bacterium]|nr:CotH kinase family protein [Akkermansiaceae bacterium]